MARGNEHLDSSNRGVHMSQQALEQEKLVAIKTAAAHFGLQYWKLQRAVKSGLIPSYAPFNARRLVYLSEIQTYINSTRAGPPSVTVSSCTGGR